MEKISPIKVLESIIGREVKWVDTSKFSNTEKKIWYGYSLDLMKNPLLISLLGDENSNGELYKTLLEIGLVQADGQTLRDIQMTLNGIELIKRAILEVEKPENKSVERFEED